jgi:molybdate transport system substrate-binding protein
VETFMKKMTIPRWLLVALAAISSVATLRADELSVAVAANFKAPAEAIADEFKKATGHKVLLSPGATGALATQIKNGAPFQVFLAADSVTPAKLIQEALAVDGTQFTYAVGKLVLWSARQGLVDEGGGILEKTDAFQHIAIANPQTAPYGAAAIEVLAQRKLLDTVRPKFVQGENIAQTYQFVASGNAELGFVALSQVFKEGKISVGSGWVVPQELYSPLRQDAVLLTRGKDSAAAKVWLEFLRGEAAGAIIASYGYMK